MAVGERREPRRAPATSLCACHPVASARRRRRSFYLRSPRLFPRPPAVMPSARRERLVLGRRGRRDDTPVGAAAPPSAAASWPSLSARTPTGLRPPLCAGRSHASRPAPAQRADARAALALDTASFCLFGALVRSDDAARAAEIVVPAQRVVEIRPLRDGFLVLTIIFRLRPAASPPARSAAPCRASSAAVPAAHARDPPSPRAPDRLAVFHHSTRHRRRGRRRPRRGAAARRPDRLRGDLALQLRRTASHARASARRQLSGGGLA